MEQMFSMLRSRFGTPGVVAVVALVVAMAALLFFTPFVAAATPKQIVNEIGASPAKKYAITPPG